MGSDSKENKLARIMKANRLLQAKTGSGSVDPKKVAASQKVIDEAKETVDFIPLANEYLKELHDAIETAKQGKTDAESLLKSLTEPVMQIKANASMFNYDLIGVLASTILNFLESIEEVNNDVISIVEKHYETIYFITEKRLSGDGKEQGKQLHAELKEACRRYFDKYDIEPKE